MEDQLRQTLDEMDSMLERLKKADNQPVVKTHKMKDKTDEKPTSKDAEEAVARLKKVPFLVNLPQHTK